MNWKKLLLGFFFCFELNFVDFYLDSCGSSYKLDFWLIGNLLIPNFIGNLEFIGSNLIQDGITVIFEIVYLKFYAKLSN